jgi:hypothetical protein
MAQNEAIETVLSRFRNKELRIPSYQRDADQWDDIKKSLFIESILYRLTVPGFYLVASETDQGVDEVVDGQQRLTTLNAFYSNEFTLCGSEKCPYFGNSAHYAGKRYDQLADNWQHNFKRYNLTLVSLPPDMETSLRLEVFRRINDGGTPLSGQDIRLGYYSESMSVRYIQTIGIFNPERDGAKRMLEDLADVWPWSVDSIKAEQWTEWWTDTKKSIGQTASEMFLWHLISVYRDQVDAILEDRERLAKNLKLTFRGNSEEVLDIICAQFRFEESNGDEQRLMPSREELRRDFGIFAKWWYRIRSNCGSAANVQKYRQIAMLIPGLQRVFASRPPSDDQWTLIGRFLKTTRETARELGLTEFPEPKGKWNSQRRQLDAFDQVAQKIARI